MGTLKVNLKYRDDKVAVVTLQHPESKNSMDEEMAEQFSSCILELQSRDDLRAVVLTGAGESFSAGGNLQMLLRKSELSAAENIAGMLKFYRSFLLIADLTVPTVAVINGPAIGAALCLALACDIRLASSNAKLGLTFIKLALHPGMGATFFLPRLVGEAHTRELLLTGRILGAEEAAKLGLVHRVTPAADLELTTAQFLEQLRQSAPETVSELKKSLFTDADRAALTAALQREAECQARDYARPEFKARLSKMLKHQ